MLCFLLGTVLRGLVILLMTAGLLGYPQAMQGTPDTAKSGEARTPEVVPATYKIGVGDVVHITVWEVPQLTETAVIRPDGKVSMPRSPRWI